MRMMVQEVNMMIHHNRKNQTNQWKSFQHSLIQQLIRANLLYYQHNVLLRRDLNYRFCYILSKKELWAKNLLSNFEFLITI